MAKIERNPLGDISNGLVAVISKAVDLPSLRQELEDHDLAESSHFFLTQEDAKELELSSDGVLKTMRKALAITMVEIEEQLVKAVESGDIVLYINIDRSDDTLKTQAQRILEQHNALTIHYFGSWSVATIHA